MDEIPTRVGRRLQHRKFCKTFLSKSGNEAFRTLIGRNANKRCNAENDVELEATSDRLLQTFLSRVVYKKQLLKITSNREEMEAMMKLAYTEFVAKVHEKGNYSQYELFDIASSKQYHTDFFLKTIEKNKMREVPPHEDPKCGQTIAAMNKSMNTIASVYHRVAEMVMRRCARPGVIFANGFSEKDLGDNIAHLLDPDCQIVEGDFREFGFTQGSITRATETKIYKAMGLFGDALQLYHESMVKRKFNCKWFSIWISEGKNDGATNTLLGNDIWNILLTLDSLNIVGLKLLCIKGDDNGILARSVSINRERFEYWTKRGVGFKFNLRVKVLKFVNWFWTDEGCFPDTVYRCMKVVSKTYESVDKLVEYQQSIRDFLAGIRTNADRLKAIACGALYHGLTFEAARLVTDYLNSFVNMEPCRLFSKMIESPSFCVTQSSV